MSADESITSLSEAVAELGALPMPAGPAPVLLSGPICSQAEARAAGLDIAPSVEELDAMAESVAALGDPLSAEVSLARAVPLLGAAVTSLRARIAELEADLAAKAQDAEAAVNGWGRARDRIAELEAERAETACTCPPAGRPHQVGCPLDGVPDAVTRTFAPVASLREDVYESPLHQVHRVGHDMPETGGAQ